MRETARLLSFTAILLLLAAACDRLLPTAMAPRPAQIRLEQPERNYRLSAADRATVIPGFDVNALERLLASVTPELRTEVLSCFQRPTTAGERRGQLYRIHDPKLQAILEEVWAPMWDSATDQELAADVYGMPGRKVALQRRAERRAREEGTAPR